MKKNFAWTAIVAILLLGGVLPAKAVSPENPGPGLTPKLSITSTLSSDPPAGSAASKFLVGFTVSPGFDPTVGGPWATPMFMPNMVSCTVDCSRVTLEIIRNGVATSYPLASLSNFLDRTYLMELEGNRTAGFVGARAGDVVRINFAEGAFELPNPSTGLVPFIRFDYVDIASGVNGIVPGSSPTASFVTIPNSAPGAPTAVAGDAQATVTIAPGTNTDGVDGYRITSSPGGKFCEITLPEMSCVVTGLTNGISYTFSASALNAVGASLASEASNEVTPSGAPTPTVTSTETLANTGSQWQVSFGVGLALVAFGLLTLAGRGKRVG